MVRIRIGHTRSRSRRKCRMARGHVIIKNGTTMLSRSLNVNFLISTFNLLIQVLLLPVLVYKIGPEAYGKYALYKTLSHTGMIGLLTFGVHIIIRRNIASLNLQSLPHRDVLKILGTIIFFLPLFLLISIIVPNDFLVPFFITTIILFNELFIVFLVACLEGMKKTSTLRFIDMSATLAIFIFALYFDCTLSTLIQFYFSANIVKSLLLLILYVRPGESKVVTDIKDLWEAAKYLSVANFFSLTNNNFEKFLFGYLLGLDTIVYLEIITRFSKIIKNQVGIFVIILQPYYQKMKNKKKFINFSSEVLNLFIPFAVALTIFFYLSTDYIIYKWMGEGYVHLTVYIQYTIPVMLLFVLNSLLGMHLVYIKNYKKSMLIQIVITSIRLVFSLLLIHIIGSWIVIFNLYVLLIIIIFAGYSRQNFHLIYKTVLLLTILIIGMYVGDIYSVKTVFQSNWLMIVILDGVILLTLLFYIKHFFKVVQELSI